MSLDGLLHSEGFSRLYFEGEEKVFGLELCVYEVGRLISSLEMSLQYGSQTISLAQKSLFNMSSPTASSVTGRAKEATSRLMSE